MSFEVCLLNIAYKYFRKATNGSGNVLIVQMVLFK